MDRSRTGILAAGIALAVVWPALCGAADGIEPGERLSLARCVALARERHPSLSAARNTLRMHLGRTGQARSAWYPQVNVSSGYSRTDPMSSSAAQSAGSAFDQYSNVLGLTQNLYDFQRTSLQVQIQELYFDASRQDLDHQTRQVVFGVRQAFYGLLQAQRVLLHTRDTVRQYEEHLARAQGLFTAGVRPKFDVTKAQVDLAQARLERLKAENAARVARSALNNALGMPDAPSFEIEDVPEPYAPTPSLEEALREAEDQRADLRALGKRRTGSEKAVDLAQRGYWPTLSGQANYGWGGSGFPLNEGWSFGASLTFPLFSGFSTKHQVEEARANRDVLQANADLLRQAIHLEVEQSLLNLKEAEERIDAAETSVRQAEENHELARGRYATGVGNPLEVTDALTALGNARTALIKAVYDRHLSRAGLEKATGAGI